ncbi:MAG: TPM domain-containing protein, partial [Myxococcota bacterium]
LDAGTDQAINGWLQELEQKTGAQFLVVTVPSLEGESESGFALALAEKWKPGRKGKDNGFIFLISKGDRKYRFETGYGLEQILPDGYLGEVGRERFVPYMKSGESSKAIYLTTITLVQKIAGDYGVTITGMPRVKQVRGRGMGGGILPIIAIIAGLFLFFGGMGRRSRFGEHRWRGGSSTMLAFLLGSMLGGGGGGRGGSDFGGFGGGGGGGFGGGGSGGSW